MTLLLLLIMYYLTYYYKKIVIKLHYVYYMFIIIFNITKIKELNKMNQLYFSNPEKIRVKNTWEGKKNTVGDFNDFSRLF